MRWRPTSCEDWQTEIDQRTPAECSNPQCGWRGIGSECVTFGDYIPRCPKCVHPVTIAADPPVIVLDTSDLADTK